MGALVPTDINCSDHRCCKQGYYLSFEHFSILLIYYSVKHSHSKTRNKLCGRASVINLSAVNKDRILLWMLHGEQRRRREAWRSASSCLYFSYINPNNRLERLLRYLSIMITGNKKYWGTPTEMTSVASLLNTKSYKPIEMKCCRCGKSSLYTKVE